MKKKRVVFNIIILKIQQDNLFEKYLFPAFWVIEQKYPFLINNNYNIYTGLSFIENKPPISSILLIGIYFTLLSKVQY